MSTRSPEDLLARLAELTGTEIAEIIRAEFGGLTVFIPRKVSAVKARRT